MSLTALGDEIVNCRKCKRLVKCCTRAAEDPPKRFVGQDYWGKPIPGFGDPEARLLVLGLAPAAHGGNRTGRVFTGDRSGDWLYGALHRAGFANQAESVSRVDGMRLTDAYVSVVVRCAPPDNAPTTTERDRCVKYLAREIALLPRLQTVIALGGFAWDGFLLVAEKRELAIPKPRPKFGHGATATLGPYQLFGSYHVSQQNTFTGRLTEAMLDDVVSKARASLSGPGPAPSH